MMKKNNNTKSRSKLNLIGYLFPILLFLYVLWTGGYGTYINYNLKQNGICTNAIVYHRYWGHRNIKTQYRFIWNNQTYEGISSNNADVKYVHQSIIKEDYVFMTGDTIVVVFLESNPKINRSNAIVKKNCTSVSAESVILR